MFPNKTAIRSVVVLWFTVAVNLPAVAETGAPPAAPELTAPPEIPIPADIPMSPTPKPKVEQLAGGRARIGPIMVDMNQRSFELQGQVIRLEPPLEFLAVKKRGYKGYESLLELDSNAVEFNTACILIGLDSSNAKVPGFQAEEKPLEGDRVRLQVSWEQDGKRYEVPAEQLLTLDGKVPGPAEWIYTGSQFSDDNRYFAELDGTIIGVIHDPSSIIEHRTGLGLEHYGAVAGNPRVAPPVGTRISLKVMHVSGPSLVPSQ